VVGSFSLALFPRLITVSGNHRGMVDQGTAVTSMLSQHDPLSWRTSSTSLIGPYETVISAACYAMIALYEASSRRVEVHLLTLSHLLNRESWSIQMPSRYVATCQHAGALRRNPGVSVICKRWEYFLAKAGAVNGQCCTVSTGALHRLGFRHVRVTIVCIARVSCPVSSLSEHVLSLTFGFAQTHC
jgi:hypothetical protein